MNFMLIDPIIIFVSLHLNYMVTLSKFLLCVINLCIALHTTKMKPRSISNLYFLSFLLKIIIIIK